MKHEAARAAFEVVEFGRGKTRARAIAGRPVVFADGHVEKDLAPKREARVLYAGGSIAVTSLQPLDLPERVTRFEQKVKEDRFMLERLQGKHWVTAKVQPDTVEAAKNTVRACPGVYRVVALNKQGKWVEVRV